MDLPTPSTLTRRAEDALERLRTDLSALISAQPPGGAPSAAHLIDAGRRLIDAGRLDVSGSVSDVLPLEDVVEGVDRLAGKRGDPIRLVVRPWA